MQATIIGLGTECLREQLAKISRYCRLKAMGELYQPFDYRNHPKVLERMDVTLDIQSKDLTDQEVRQALKVAEMRFAPCGPCSRGIWKLI